MGWCCTAADFFFRLDEISLLRPASASPLPSALLPAWQRRMSWLLRRWVPAFSQAVVSFDMYFREQLSLNGGDIAVIL